MSDHPNATETRAAGLLQAGELVILSGEDPVRAAFSARRIAQALTAAGTVPVLVDVRRACDERDLARRIVRATSTALGLVDPQERWPWDPGADPQNTTTATIFLRRHAGPWLDELTTQDRKPDPTIAGHAVEALYATASDRDVQAALLLVGADEMTPSGMSRFVSPVRALWAIRSAWQQGSARPLLLATGSNPSKLASAEDAPFLGAGHHLDLDLGPAPPTNAEETVQGLAWRVLRLASAVHRLAVPVLTSIAVDGRPYARRDWRSKISIHRALGSLRAAGLLAHHEAASTAWSINDPALAELLRADSTDAL